MQNELIVIQKTELQKMIEESITKAIKNLTLSEKEFKSVMNKKEASEYLKCSQSMINKLMSRGDVKFMKNGSRVLFKKSELDRYLNARNNQIFKCL